MDKRSDSKTHNLKITSQGLYLDDFKIKRVTKARVEADIDSDGVSAKLLLEILVNPKIILDYFGDNTGSDLEHGT
jgi:hypothetical protein